MNILMGSHVFDNVEVPVLWGERAIIQDRKGRLSVIDLSKDKARPEIIGDSPAPGVQFKPKVDGFVILLEDGREYTYSPDQKLLSSESLDLPECQVTGDAIRVGGAVFQSNLISGSAVGIMVSREGIGMGAPLPRQLADLLV